MFTTYSITLRSALRAAAAASLLACAQAHAATTTAQNLSSGLGTLLRYLLPAWF